jgi:acetyltransferase-like isoleucine patch superfamily enzyme
MPAQSLKIKERAFDGAPSPLGRRVFSERIEGAPNAHRYWYRARNQRDGAILGPLRIVFNYVVIYGAKHLPSLALKRALFRALGMKLGENVTIASGVTLDYFFPELIEIGDETIVGMDATVLTHEFLHDRLRYGPVRIGKNVLLGASSLVLAGVEIGDGAKVSAMSLVNKSVGRGAFVGGNPLAVLRSPSAGAPGDP